MDDRGHLHPLLEDEALHEASQRLDRCLVPVEPRDVQELRSKSPAKRKNWMRNKPCPCGSGRKFKKCHWYQFGGFERKAEGDQAERQMAEQEE